MQVCLKLVYVRVNLTSKPDGILNLFISSTNKYRNKFAPELSEREREREKCFLSSPVASLDALREREKCFTSWKVSLWITPRMRYHLAKQAVACLLMLLRASCCKFAILLHIWAVIQADFTAAGLCCASHWALGTRDSGSA